MTCKDVQIVPASAVASHACPFVALHDVHIAVSTCGASLHLALATVNMLHSAVDALPQFRTFIAHTDGSRPMTPPPSCEPTIVPDAPPGIMHPAPSGEAIIPAIPTEEVYFRHETFDISSDADVFDLYQDRLDCNRVANIVLESSPYSCTDVIALADPSPRWSDLVEDYTPAPVAFPQSPASDGAFHKPAPPDVTVEKICGDVSPEVARSFCRGRWKGRGPGAPHAKSVVEKYVEEPLAQILDSIALAHRVQLQDVVSQGDDTNTSCSGRGKGKSSSDHKKLQPQSQPKCADKPAVEDIVAVPPVKIPATTFPGPQEQPTIGESIPPNPIVPVQMSGEQLLRAVRIFANAASNIQMFLAIGYAMLGNIDNMPSLEWLGVQESFHSVFRNGLNEAHFAHDVQGRAAIKRLHEHYQIIIGRHASIASEVQDAPT